MNNAAIWHSLPTIKPASKADWHCTLSAIEAPFGVRAKSNRKPASASKTASNSGKPAKVKNFKSLETFLA